MWQTSTYVLRRLQMVSRCLQRIPGGIIGCGEPRHMSCKGSRWSPGVSSGFQEVLFDVANLVVCLAKAPDGLQVSPVDSRRYYWMWRTSTYVLRRPQMVSRCLQRIPGGIIHRGESRSMSCEGSRWSPGVSSEFQEVLLDVANLDICLAKAPDGLQVSPANSRRYYWMWRTSTYVLRRLQMVSRCLQRIPGGIIGRGESRSMSCEGSRWSPGVSSRFQEVLLAVANLVVCLAKGPDGLQVSPADSRRYYWPWRIS